MSRNFGIMSGRTASGGFDDRPSATLDIYAPSDSILLPSGNLPLPRSEFAQAVLDILALLSAFLFVSTTGCGIAFAVFVLFFVHVG